MERLEGRVLPTKTKVLMCVLLAGLTMHPGASEAKPVLLLGSISDAEAVTALKNGFSLPTIAEKDPSLFNMSVHEWVVKIANEKLRLAAILRAYGYLNASIKQGVDFTDSIQLEPVPGNIYRIGSIELRGVIGSDLGTVVQEELSALLARYAGAIVRADNLDELEGEIVWRVLRASHPFVRVKARNVLPDHRTSTATVQIVIEAGRSTRFGAVALNGLLRISPHALVRHIPFSEGDNFDPLKLNALKLNLEQLAIFREVDVELGSASVTGDFLPVHVQLTEKNPAPKDLAVTGFTGLIITAVTLVILGINQIAIAGGASQLLARTLSLVCIRLLAISGLLAFYRVLTFFVAT
jgi:hypothetical protein